MIAIVVLTHGRVDLLRRCVENVILRTSELTVEVVVWDNASSDGTRAYLDGLTDARVRVVHHPENIAVNALPRAIRRTTAPYIVVLDDDVVEAPERWDETLLQAYRRLPEIGFLCASIAYHPDDSASRYLRYMREEVGAFSEGEVNGVRLLHGSVGGACTMTARDLYERVGGFGEHPKYPYWRWEIPYLRAIRKRGYDSAYLLELEVRHEGGRDPTRVPGPKVDYYYYEVKTTARKDMAKRAILAIPFAAALNRRYRWFDPPLPPFDPEAYGPVAPEGSSHGPTQAS